MMRSPERQQEKPNQLKEQKVKSLKFFKPTLATALAIVLAWLLSVRPAQAGYTVTLQQVWPDVVATGSGAITTPARAKPRFGTSITMFLSAAPLVQLCPLTGEWSACRTSMAITNPIISFSIPAPVKRESGICPAPRYSVAHTGRALQAAIL